MMAHLCAMTLQHHEAEFAVKRGPTCSPVIVPPGTNLKACGSPVPVPRVHIVNRIVARVALVPRCEQDRVVCTGAGRGCAEGDVVDSSAGLKSP